MEELDEHNSRIVRQTVYTTFSYSYEYGAFRDPSDGFIILSSIVDKDHGGGGLLDKNAQLFTAETLTVTDDYNPLVVIWYFYDSIVYVKYQFDMLYYIWIHVEFPLY